MRIISMYLVMLALVALFVGCQDHDLQNEILVQNDLLLSGIQEVPANASPATGSAVIKYNRTTKMLEYTVTFNNLTGSPVAGHIHGSAPRGKNTGVLIPFMNLPKATSGVIVGSAKLDPDQEEDLMNGLFYINLHTEKYKGGEIRGQIEFYNQRYIISKMCLPIDANQAGLANNTNDRGTGTMDIVYNKRTKLLSYSITWEANFQSVANTISGPAAKKEKGAILVLIDNYPAEKANNGNYPMALNGSLVVDEAKLKEADLLAGLYYFEAYSFVSSTVNIAPLRGQIEF